MIDIKIIQAIVREAAELFSNRKAVRQVREKGAYDYVTAVEEWFGGDIPTEQIEQLICEVNTENL